MIFLVRHQCAIPVKVRHTKRNEVKRKIPIYRITAPLIEYCKILQNCKITIRNAQVVGSSPIPSSRTNRFVKPFG